jgi:hypothetical protein
VFIIDTNILLHSVNSDSPVHKQARKALESYVNGAERYGFSWNIIYEFFRVSTHPRVFQQPLSFKQAQEFMSQVLGGNAAFVVSETDLHAEMIEQCRRKTHRLAGNLVHDFHTAVLMREHGVKEIVTLDEDFKAFSWVSIRGMCVAGESKG